MNKILAYALTLVFGIICIISINTFLLALSLMVFDYMVIFFFSAVISLFLLIMAFMGADE